VKGKPTLIIAKTTKGKGVSYAEDVVGYHGIAPKDGRSGKESLDRALEDIGDSSFTKEKVDKLLKIAADYQKKVNKKIEASMPQFTKDYWWNADDTMMKELLP
jgi:transketolase